jgi:hypothetical protein
VTANGVKDSYQSSSAMTASEGSLSTLCYTAACEQPAGVCEIKR